KVLNYTPLLAEAKLQHGRLLHESGQLIAAENDLTDAYTLAAEHGHDEVALHAARNLGFIVGRQARHMEGNLWINVALPLARRSGEAEHIASSLGTLGVIFEGQGRYEEAEQKLRQALKIGEDAFGSGHRTVAVSMSTLATILNKQGRHKEAAEYYQQAIQIFTDSLGPNHPTVAVCIDALGTALN